MRVQPSGGEIFPDRKRGEVCGKLLQVKEFRRDAAKIRPYNGNMKMDRKILPPSEIQSPMGDQGAEGTRKSPEPSTSGALGSESGHGDIANWHQRQSDYGSVHPGGSAGFALQEGNNK